MSSQKTWRKGTIAGVGAFVLVASMMFPATAMNRGTVNGNETNGCNVVWKAESVLDIDLQQDDPQYRDLVHDEKDQAAGQNYQYTGFIKEVSPKFKKTPLDPGYMEIGHHYQNGDVDTPVRVAAANTKQVWRVNFGTEKALSNAKIVFTLPQGVQGKPVTVDVNSGVNAVNTWPHAPYNTYNAQRTPLAPGAVTNTGNNTWTINMGDLPAMSSRVVDFHVEVGTSLNLTDQFVASAVLTARGTDAACQQPAKPADQVVYSEWQDGEKVCTKPTVTQTRTKTVATHTWDSDNNVWKLGTPVVTTETQERPKTQPEHEACKPADLVEYSQWQDGEKVCTKPTVTQTRTKTVTPHVFEDATKTWKPGTPVVTTETQERPKTQEEREACKPADLVEYSQWQDGEKVCTKPTVTQTRTKTVTPHTWDTATNAWIPGTPVVTTETQEREKTQDEYEACKPADQVEFSQWQDGEKVCTKPTVTQTRTKTVTSSVFDATSKTWKPGTPVVTTETQEREKTQDEHEACKPADKVELSEWKDGKVSCEAVKVTQTRTKTVTDHVFDATSKTWKPGNSVVTTETQERDKTDQEKASCSTAEKPQTKKLAQTGSLTAPLATVAGALALGGLAFVAARRRRA